MTVEKHDIDPWFIPDDEKVIASEAEQKHAEEHGELPDEPLCPYCGDPYKESQNGIYTHAYVRKQVRDGLETKEVLKPGILCVSDDDKRFENGVMAAATGDIV